MLFNRLISEVVKIVCGLKPDANALAGTKYSDIFCMSMFGKACAILEIGEGETGTTKVTVEACSDSTDSLSDHEAITFKRRHVTADTDLPGAVTATASTGFDTTAGGGDRYLIEFDAADLPDGKPWVRIKCVEQVASAVDAAMTILLAPCRYGGTDLPTAIS